MNTKLALIPQPLLPSLGADVKVPLPNLGEGFRVRARIYAGDDHELRSQPRMKMDFHLAKLGEKTVIELYYWTTPNGHKITMFLEEVGLPYTIVPVNTF